MSLNLFIVAGEASSDLHAAQVLKEFKRLHPEVRCFGIGGKQLEAQGMEVIVPAAQISAFGGTDWIDRASEIIAGYKKAVQSVYHRRPDLALLLDLPDFNLRIAKKLKAVGVPTAYYFSPQVWAWRKSRVHTIKRLMNKMLVAFPFEKKFYEENGVGVEFVGHPVLESVEARTHYRTNEEIAGRFRVAILPGSRKSELKQHAQMLKEVVKRLRVAYPLCEIRIPVASTLTKEAMTAAFGSNVEIIEGKATEVMSWADVALVASGTATLECAVIGTPFALFYRVSALSALYFKWLIPYKGPIGMPNILLNKIAAKEFFQERATADALYEELTRLLEDGDTRTELGKTLLSCRETLGGKGASQRAAFQLHRLYYAPEPT